jgi:hypothetical protein
MDYGFHLYAYWSCLISNWQLFQLTTAMICICGGILNKRFTSSDAQLKLHHDMLEIFVICISESFEEWKNGKAQ